MAGGRTSNWADAVSATLERLDVAETIEELRRQVDELIARLAQQDPAATAPERKAQENLDVDVDELGRKVEGASDLLAELADVLESQTERIETIEQQLGDPDRTLEPAAAVSSGRASADLLDPFLQQLDGLRQLIESRFGSFERQLRRIESRLDDMLALAGEGQREVAELGEQLTLLSASSSVEPPGLAELLGDVDRTLKQPVLEVEEGGGESTVVEPAELETASQEPAEAPPPAESAPRRTEAGDGEPWDAAAAAGRASDAALAAAMSRAEQDIARAAALAASLTRANPDSPARSNGSDGEEGVPGNGHGAPRLTASVEQQPVGERRLEPGAELSIEPMRKRSGKAHPTVLVVDDVADARMILSVYLSKTGYQVVTAASAEDCLAKLRHHDVDAIVLDARMPGADGRHVCRILAEDPAFESKRTTPVIVYTGHPQEFTRDDVLAWGASEYVVKGGDMLPLISALVRFTQPCQEEAQ